MVSSKSSKSKSKLHKVIPAIPFKRPEPKEYNSQNYLSNKCYSIPGDANSNTYNVSVQYFEEGTPEEWLQLLAAHARICQGQNIANGPGTYNALMRHLKGPILSKFTAKRPPIDPPPKIQIFIVQVLIFWQDQFFVSFQYYPWGFH